MTTGTSLLDNLNPIVIGVSLLIDERQAYHCWLATQLDSNCTTVGLYYYLIELCVSDPKFWFNLFKKIVVCSPFFPLSYHLITVLPPPLLPHSGHVGGGSGWWPPRRARRWRGLVNLLGKRAGGLGHRLPCLGQGGEAASPTAYSGHRHTSGRPSRSAHRGTSVWEARPPLQIERWIVTYATKQWALHCLVVVIGMHLCCFDWTYTCNTCTHNAKAHRPTHTQTRAHTLKRAPQSARLSYTTRHSAKAHSTC